MSVKNLDYLFKPKSLAVIGASNRPGSVGSTVMKNLLDAGFQGPVMPVNPKHEAVSGVLAYPDVDSLPLTPQLAVICTPPQIVPGLIVKLGERGTRAAIILTAGLGQENDEGVPLKAAALKAAGRFGLRLLGPNCLGLISSQAALNASFAHIRSHRGSLAFVSQSGALCTAVLDWCYSKRIGFSHFVSLGDMADVDFGDVLDYLGADPKTRAMLLYIESIKYSRKFMSAARAAARNKPVLVIKSGRMEEGARAAASHTGALAGSDDVYDAAIRRAGMLRVFEIEELFDAVETLARPQRSKGDELVILTNGGGPGVMAADCLAAGGGRLTELSHESIRKLDEILPPTWSRANPVDIIGDARPDRYKAALKILLEDPQVESVLVMHVPTAICSSPEAARAVVEAASGARPSLLTSWLGGESVAAARSLFAEADIPSYDTPEQAIRAFLHMLEYRRNQQALMEVPSAAPAGFTPAQDTAKLIIQGVLAEGRQMLSEAEAKAVLAAYGIPIVQTAIASDAQSALVQAEAMGFPVAVKIISPEISHKSDVGGVALDLETPEDVSKAVEGMKARMGEIRPEARIAGFTVQKMARRPGAYELIAGASTDPVFGPVLLFGEGGTAVDVIRDRALALPPLNMNLARNLVSRTRISRLLKGYRDRPAVDLDSLCLTLLQISQLVTDLAEVAELDINPLLADSEGVLALDARMVVKHAPAAGSARLAIKPYPSELEEFVKLPSGSRLLLRPIRPEDEPAHMEFHSRLAPEDIRARFFGLVREMAHSEMARYTQIDYDREMAFIAIGKGKGNEDGTLGVVRMVRTADLSTAEFAVIVRSDLKRKGLGRILMEKIMRYCRERGIRELVGQVLADNRAMLSLIGSLGFEEKRTDTGIVEVRLRLSG